MTGRDDRRTPSGPSGPSDADSLSRPSRPDWRRTSAFLLALGTCATLLFAGVASESRASFLERVRDTFASTVRTLTGGAGEDDAPARIEARSSRSWAMEAMEKRRDRELLRVAGHELRPARDEVVPQATLSELLAPRTPLVPSALLGTDEADAEYWILQYEGRPQAYRKKIESEGLEILAWIPNSAYLVRGHAQDLAGAESLRETSWASRFQTSWKVPSDVVSFVSSGDTTQMPVDDRGHVRLAVKLFAGAAVQPNAELIKTLPGLGVRDIHELEGVVTVDVDPRDLRTVVIDLAQVRDVEAILPDPIPTAHNDDSVWYLQTGIDAVNDYDTSARLFRLGINGRGLIGAVADSGLENDACWFRYGPAINDAAWVVGPDDDLPVPDEGGALPDDLTTTPPVRTRARKVVAYYLMDGATAYEQAGTDAHGTWVAGCMLADNYEVLAARPLIRDLGVRQNVAPWNATGDWAVGESLRSELASRIDDPTTSEAGFPTTYGTNVQHHQLGDGMAPGAQLVMQDIGSVGGLTGSFGGASLLLQAHDTGATAHNTSFGGDLCDPATCYDNRAQNGDFVTWRRRDFVMASSAGNRGAAGGSSITRGYAQARNVIAVGGTVHPTDPSQPPATRRGENVWGTSSRGPKAGGLLAPDLVTPALDVATTGDTSFATPEDGTGSGNDPCGRNAVQRVPGTSFASPLLSGTSLLVQQYFRDGFYPTGEAVEANRFRPTNALVRAILINSTKNLLGNAGGDRPNFDQGWGSPRLDDTLYFAGDPILDVDPEAPLGTQRARLLVITDTPNGHADETANPLAVEPGGSTRAEIVQNYRTAITDTDIHDHFVNIVKTDVNGDGDLDEPANEVRITLAWYDMFGAIGTPGTNELDLEVISPGPDGVLDTDSEDTLQGDDVVYRPNPMTVWSGGYTQPATEQQIQRFDTGSFTDFVDRDPINPVENVFIPASEVVSGTWRIRVIGFDVPGAQTTSDGRPNFYDGEATIPEERDLDGDGSADAEVRDRIDASNQGYALVLGGNFTTTQGLVSLNRSTFDCSGQELIVTLNDENGDAPRAACDPGDGALEDVLLVDITTTTSSVGFPSDLEVVEMLSASGPPTYRSDPISVFVTNDPAEVIHGNGRIEVQPDEQIVASYVDGDPCGGTSFAQASVSCRPSVGDSGFSIDDGCDRTNPSDPTSTIRPDDFIDAGELVTYTVFMVNTGRQLNDARVSLVPDPEDPVATYLDVLNAPQVVGLMPPGRRSDAAFLVQVADLVCDPASGEPPVDGSMAVDCNPASATFNPNGVPRQYEMDFIVSVTSPADGLLFPDTFRQTQVLESDLLQFWYNTRDPNGEFFSQGRIREPLADVDEATSTNPDDFRQYEPMWYDPDAICEAGPPAQTCAEVCGSWTRDMSDLPPAACTMNATGNHLNAWDFDDSDDNFVPAAHDGDAPIVPGPGGVAEEWFWKSGPDGGGCGWENELVDALANGDGPNPNRLPVGHPDLAPQPWGIWHTGEINPVETGPYNGDVTNNQGVPFFDPPNTDEHPLFHSIFIGPSEGAPADNTSGQWCDSYLTDRTLGTDSFYRSLLIPPRLHRVHQSDRSFRVEFRQLRFHSRMDGHTIDANNLAIGGWYFSNEPVEPLQMNPLTYSWAQFQTGTIIFTDQVRNDWSVDDNTLGENLRSLNEDFPDLTYEDNFGPAEDSWNFALTWGHLFLDGRTREGLYGFGIDDVEFIWTESKEQPDGSECFPGGGAGVQPPSAFFSSERYNACAGDLDLTVIDPNQAATTIGVCVSSSEEDGPGELAVLRQTDPALGRYEGSLPFTSDPSEETDGILLINAGQVDIGNGASNLTLEYDPVNEDFAMMDREAICDWQDTSPADGVNDDTDADGTPDAADSDGDGTPDEGEVFDFSVANCTSGRLYYIKHELVQDGPGDGDGYADHGETHFLELTLLNDLGADLQDVRVSISTEDSTVCLINDAVEMDLLPSDLLTETPVNTSTGVGLRFAVPAAVRTTDLEAPQTVTFRVDVTGVRTDDLNEFSTRGTAFSSFLAQEARLILDVDRRTTAVNYEDSDGPGGVNRQGRMPGEWRENFEAGGSEEHLRIPGVSPGIRFLELNALEDTRYGAADNNGFCPECDQFTECLVPADCAYRFVPEEYPRLTEWHVTDDWAKELVDQYGFPGTAAAKFGREAPPDQREQHYAEGQFTALELPPIDIATDFAAGERPELRFWHIADFWQPFFTSGLVTPIGAGKVEISARPTGLTTNAELSSETALNSAFPLSSYVPLYPEENGYDNETDALNACRTYFCGGHHPVFEGQGDMIEAPASTTDPRRGSLGGTWNEVVVDLSDYEGMQVSIRFVTAVLQEIVPQNGEFGWVVDDIRVLGATADGTAFNLQAGDPTGLDPCGLQAAFVSTSADCAGGPVQFFDRHAGLGAFQGATDPEPGEPFPIEYEWEIDGNLIPRGFGDDPLSGAGLSGTHANPRVNLTDAFGMGPGVYDATQRLYQDGALVSQTTGTIVYKDAPVPVITAPDPVFVDAAARFASSVSFDTVIDSDRTLIYEWDFGDGTAIDTSGPMPTHVFGATGVYDVTLTVFDEDGCSSSTTESVTVVDGPDFTRPRVDPATVVDCGNGDGNADINEVITVEIEFDNVGAPASDVVAFLSSSDPSVDIVGGVAFYGPVGATSGTQPFSFIVRDTGQTLSCVIVPLTLTVVSDDGTVEEVLELSYALGNASDSSYDGTAAGDVPASATGTPTEEVVVPIAVPNAGCLDGIEMTIDVAGTGSGFQLNNLEVFLISPTFERVDLKFQGTGGIEQAQVIDFAFGANDGDAPVPDTDGEVLDRGDNLTDIALTSQIPGLVGDAMDGTWELHCRDRSAFPDPASTFTCTVEVFDLEGQLSGDVSVEPDPDCNGCVTAAAPAPVFNGARSSCVGGGSLFWTPAEDPTTCAGDDITYEIYVSDIAGELGAPATEVGDCSECMDPDGACFVTRGRRATIVRVCDVESVYWTVVAVDQTTGARTPNVSAPTDDPGMYQVDPLGPCAGPITAPIIGLTKLGNTLELSMVGVPGVPVRPAMNATEHRLFIGTIPADGTLASRATPYDHDSSRPGASCSFTELTRDMSDQLTRVGSFYYLVAGSNSGGCAGIDVPTDLPSPGRMTLDRPGGNCPGGVCAP